MRIPYFQVNAFAASTFGGNPAGVCPLERWLPDRLLLRIAAENNLSETAYFVPQGDSFHLRWFTPAVEVDLCGHATLATAFVLFSELEHPAQNLRFHTRSGWLSAGRRGELIELDFPSRAPTPCAIPEDLVRGLLAQPREVFKSRDYLAVFDSPAEVAALAPDMDLLENLDCLGVIATAAGSWSNYPAAAPKPISPPPAAHAASDLDSITAAYLEQQLAAMPPPADFVSRFFAPRAGVPEDPVTGSAHSTLIPFWAERLNKTEMLARQISRRGGELHCRLLGDRVAIGGYATIYCRGELEIGDYLRKT